MFNSYVKLPDGSAVLITSDFFISSPWRWLRMLVQLQSNCHSKGNFFGPEAAGVGFFFGQPLGTVDFHFANWRLWWKKKQEPPKSLRAFDTISLGNIGCRGNIGPWRLVWTLCLNRRLTCFSGPVASCVHVKCIQFDGPVSLTTQASCCKIFLVFNRQCHNVLLGISTNKNKNIVQ